jgi:membrane fusion protein, multidrug efflux system
MQQILAISGLIFLISMPVQIALAKSPCVTRQELTAHSTGIVKRYHASNGDVVKRGAPIIEFDSRLLKAGYKEARAAVDAATGNEELATDALSRLEKLAGSEAVSEQQVAEARIRLSQARALKRQAEAAAERVKVQLEDTLIRAEVAGRVQGLPTILGMVVQVGQSLGSVEANSAGCPSGNDVKSN